MKKWGDQFDLKKILRKWHFFSSIRPPVRDGSFYDFYDIILAAAPLRATGLIKIHPGEEFFGLDGRRGLATVNRNPGDGSLFAESCGPDSNPSWQGGDRGASSGARE